MYKYIIIIILLMILFLFSQFSTCDKTFCIDSCNLKFLLTFVRQHILNNFMIHNIKFKIIYNIQ